MFSASFKVCPQDVDKNVTVVLSSDGQILNSNLNLVATKKMLKDTVIYIGGVQGDTILYFDQKNKKVPNTASNILISVFYP